MENLITINSELRQETGKRVSKSLRHLGKIPAVIYGGRNDTLNVTVDINDIRTILHSESGENSILRIVHEKKNKIDAMIKEIQYDFLSKYVIHVDFIRIDLDKPVEVAVPIFLEGEPVGVRLEDGLLDFVNREVQVRCLPTRIPKEIRLVIADLHVGHSLKVENLPQSEGVQYISTPQTVICAVVTKGREEVVEKVAEVVPTEEAAAAEGAAPAAEGEEKEKKPEEKKDKKGDEKKEKKEG